MPSVERPLDQGVFRRAYADLRKLSEALWFKVAVLAPNGAAAVAAALIPDKEPWQLRAGVGLATVILGPLLASFIVFIGLALRAPFNQRNEAREAYDEAVKEGERRLAEADAERERQLTAAGEDAERRLREAAAESAERVERVETERDTALQRIEELEAEEDPDPRIALANRAARLAAHLRALCVEAEGRMSAGRGLRPLGEVNERADREQADALARYEREHSEEAYEVFDQLVGARVMDPERRRHIERPRFLDDLRTAAEHMQEAAKRLRERAEADPIEVDRVQLAHAAYKKGTAVVERNSRGEGAPTNPEELAEANRLAWRRVIDWTQETWVMLHKYFPPTWERRFYGDDEGVSREMGKWGIWLVIDGERSKGARPNTSMERRLSVLVELLEEYKP